MWLVITSTISIKKHNNVLRSTFIAVTNTSWNIEGGTLGAIILPYSQNTIIKIIVRYYLPTSSAARNEFPNFVRQCMPVRRLEIEV
jgi:hypothetical protein